MTFDDPSMATLLEAMGDAEINDLDYGVVGLDQEGLVECYNVHEERYSGLSRTRVVGRPFFFDVAPCMNNYLVAERLEEASLDVTLPYVLTFRMRPTPVKLRLIRTPTFRRRWVLISRV
ncbi:phosphonate transporter [Lichenicola cladoniae]|uniref:Phosphonate transporter n=1 Tax=Lichenicola cladoniae TaxID=1484109 RepID=A0A6M8HTR5_9PROT|nr:phosphonate transporter [Lichenicola cladoniae]NPD70365.1 phosphonate transporter [Acetobacteraceae bacterium]QKE91903.1 phosphonate transporter [Lichenicola cladoniae]